MVGMINLCFVGGDGRDWRPATPVTAKSAGMGLDRGARSFSFVARRISGLFGPSKVPAHRG
jgi:hypothetical protein